MKQSRLFKITGAILILIGVIFASIVYGWQLSVILIIVLTGNNLEQNAWRFEISELLEEKFFNNKEMEDDKT